MSWQSYFVPLTLVGDTSVYNKRIEVVESFGTLRLLVNGIEQTGRYTESLFQQGLHALRRWHAGPMKRIAVVGVGGGGVFKRLRSMYPDSHLVGVDIDEKIIHIAKEYFHVKIIPGVTFLVSDAQKFTEKKEYRDTFDCVVIDIYCGNDVPEFVTQARFVRSIRSIVRDRGSVMINYFRFKNQREKSGEFLKLLTSVFSEVQSEVNHKNIFFYCRK